MNTVHPGMNQKNSFMRSHAMKLSLIWILFALAVLGTYLLSHKIQLQGANYASVFMANLPSHEVSLYSGKADPALIEASPGDEVVFSVKDDSRHNIAEERTQRREARLESGEIGKDESYSLVFNGAGTFSFYDRLNQDIRVTVTIR